jgi:hypothetical protein
VNKLEEINKIENKEELIYKDQKRLIDSDKLAAIDNYFKKDWEHIKHVSI